MSADKSEAGERWIREWWDSQRDALTYSRSDAPLGELLDDRDGLPLRDLLHVIYGDTETNSECGLIDRENHADHITYNALKDSALLMIAVAAALNHDHDEGAQLSTDQASALLVRAAKRAAAAHAVQKIIPDEVRKEPSR